MARPTAFDPKGYPERLLRQFPKETQALIKPLCEKVVRCVLVNYKGHTTTFYFKDELEAYLAQHKIRDVLISTTDGCGYGHREPEEALEMKWFTPQL